MDKPRIKNTKKIIVPLLFDCNNKKFFIKNLNFKEKSILIEPNVRLFGDSECNRSKEAFLGIFDRYFQLVFVSYNSYNT